MEILHNKDSYSSLSTVTQVETKSNTAILVLFKVKVKVL